jgi:hypothetical protein
MAHRGCSDRSTSHAIGINSSVRQDHLRREGISLQFASQALHLNINASIKDVIACVHWCGDLHPRSGAAHDDLQNVIRQRPLQRLASSYRVHGPISRFAFIPEKVG